MAKDITRNDTATVTDIPSYLQPILTGPTGAFPQFQAAQGALPSLTALGTGAPQMDIPGLTPDQQAQINAILQTGSTSPDLMAARQQLQALTSGPIGSSPATLAGMQAFQHLVAPQVMQAEALQGRAGGGAALEAMSQASTQAALPLIQNELAQRQAAVGQYTGLQQAQLNSLAAALEAAGMPREVALQQAQAAFNKANANYQFQSNLQSAPLNLMNSLLGQHSTGRQQAYQTKTGEDWLSGGLRMAGDIFGGF